MVENIYHGLILLVDLITTSFKCVQKLFFAMLILNMKTCQKGSDIDDHYAVYVVFACFFIFESILFLLPFFAVQGCG